jgi:WD40 repeat protein
VIQFVILGLIGYSAVQAFPPAKQVSLGSTLWAQEASDAIEIRTRAKGSKLTDPPVCSFALKPKSVVTSLVFSSDDHYLLAQLETEVIVWSMATGKSVLRRPAKKMMRGLFFHRSDLVIQLPEKASDAEYYWISDTDAAHRTIAPVVFQDILKVIVTAKGAIEVLDQKGQVSYTLTPGAVREIMVDKKGQFLAAACEKEAYIWSIADGKQLTKTPINNREGANVVMGFLEQDGRTILSISEGKTTQSIDPLVPLAKK